MPATTKQRICHNPRHCDATELSDDKADPVILEHRHGNDILVTYPGMKPGECIYCMIEELAMYRELDELIEELRACLERHRKKKFSTKLCKTKSKQS